AGVPSTCGVRLPWLGALSSIFDENLDDVGLRVSLIKYPRPAAASAPSSAILSLANAIKNFVSKGRATSSESLLPRSASQYCSQARRKARARILGRSSCPESVGILVRELARIPNQVQGAKCSIAAEMRIPNPEQCANSCPALCYVTPHRVFHN